MTTLGIYVESRQFSSTTKPNDAIFAKFKKNVRPKSFLLQVSIRASEWIHRSSRGLNSPSNNKCRSHEDSKLWKIALGIFIHLQILIHSYIYYRGVCYNIKAKRRFQLLCNVVGAGLLSDMQSCGFRMRRECRERFPRHQLQRKPLFSKPGMHHVTCVTHVLWCMLRSLTRGSEEIPGARA